MKMKIYFLKIKTMIIKIKIFNFKKNNKIIVFQIYFYKMMKCYLKMLIMSIN